MSFQSILTLHHVILTLHFVTRLSALLFDAFSVMMGMFGRRFTPCTTLEFFRHSRWFVGLAMCVCLRGFFSGSRKRGTLIPFAWLLTFGQSLNVTFVVGHFSCLLPHHISTCLTTSLTWCSLFLVHSHPALLLLLRLHYITLLVCADEVLFGLSLL